MQTAAVSSLLGMAGTALASGAPSSAQAAPFADVLKSAVAGVDDLQQQAATSVEGLLRGTGVDIHEAMIATEKSDMAFELALSVRNKAVAAYQQVMGMQF